MANEGALKVEEFMQEWVEWRNNDHDYLRLPGQCKRTLMESTTSAAMPERNRNFMIASNVTDALILQQPHYPDHGTVKKRIFTCKRAENRQAHGAGVSGISAGAV